MANIIHNSKVIPPYYSSWVDLYNELLKTLRPDIDECIIQTHNHEPVFTFDINHVRAMALDEIMELLPNKGQKEDLIRIVTPERCRGFRLGRDLPRLIRMLPTKNY